MTVSARLYNWHELNRPRPYPECLVMEGAPAECAAYMHEHDPDGNFLCYEEGWPDGTERVRFLQSKAVSA